MWGSMPDHRVARSASTWSRHTDPMAGSGSGPTSSGRRSAAVSRMSTTSSSCAAAHARRYQSGRVPGPEVSERSVYEKEETIMNDKLQQPIHEEDSSLTQEEDLFFPAEEEDLFLPAEEEDLPSRAEVFPFSPPEP